MFANLFLSDLGLYNEAVKITHEFPQFFPLGVVQYGWTILMIARELHWRLLKEAPDIWRSNSCDF